jgi:hypothetical protein
MPSCRGKGQLLPLRSSHTSVVGSSEKIRNALCLGSRVLELSERVNNRTVTWGWGFRYVGLEVGIYAADRTRRT